MFKMEFNNDKIFETKECKDFVKRVVNYDSIIIKTSSFLKENFNVDLELTENGDITLKAGDGCVNESQSLLDAKEYVKNNLDPDYYNEVLFI